MAESRFVLEWTDSQGGHLGYNYRRTTVGLDGQNRVLYHYDEPPTFENTYRDYYVGITPVVGQDGEIRSGSLYPST